jgi:hypothetical protein
MGRMGALLPELWRQHQGQEACLPIFNPVMYMQVRELVLMGRMGVWQPGLWR